MGGRHEQKRVPIDGSVLCQEVLSLHEDVSKGPLKRVTPNHLLEVGAGYMDSG